MSWVYKAYSDPELAKTQPTGLKKWFDDNNQRGLEFPFTPGFAMSHIPSDPASYNNLFMQQNDEFVPFDQDLDDYEEDYDEGEIRDDSEEDSQSMQIDTADSYNPNLMSNGRSAEMSQQQLPTAASGTKIAVSHLSVPPTATPRKTAAELKAVLMANKSRTTPMRNPSREASTTIPQPRASNSRAPHSSPDKASTAALMEGFDDLLEQGKAAAAAAEQRRAREEIAQAIPPRQAKEPITAAGASLGEREQHNRLESLSSRLRTATEPTDRPSYHSPDPRSAQAAITMQSPSRLRTAPAEKAMVHGGNAGTGAVVKMTEKLPTGPAMTGRKNATGNALVTAPVKSEPKVHQSLQKDRTDERNIPQQVSQVSSDHYEGLEEWLQLTDFHNIEYRLEVLARERKKRQLRRQLEELEQQDVLSRQAVRVDTQAPESVVEKLSHSMAPPPLPGKYVSGKILDSIPTPLNTPPTSAENFPDHKHRRSPQSSRDMDAPAAKAARYSNGGYDREYNARTEGPGDRPYSRPTSPMRGPRRTGRSPSPRAVPLEDRVGRPSGANGPGRRTSYDQYAPSNSYYDGARDDRAGYHKNDDRSSYQKNDEKQGQNKNIRGGYHHGNKQWKNQSARGGKKGQ